MKPTETTAAAYAEYVRARDAYTPPPAAPAPPPAAPAARTFTPRTDVKECFFTRVDKETGEVRRGRRVIVRVFLTVSTGTRTGRTEDLTYTFYVHSRGGVRETRVLVPAVGEHGEEEVVTVEEFVPRARRMWGAERAAAVLADVAYRLKA